MSNRDLLKKLADMRTDHYKSAKKNRDYSHSIIGEQLYSKQSHFIFELLQNAEDEEATKVKISFNSQELVFEHNGRPFDITDIEAITSFGNNEKKKLKPNAIGRFGIGFKSVFSVTEKPEIKSGDFHFAISNFIVPNLIDSEKSKATIITLPFKSSKKSQIVSKIETALSDLDSTYLLFLNNITSIEINDWRSGESRLIKLKRNNYKDSTLKLFSLSEGENQKEFLLFEDTVTIAKKKLPIKIAFSILRKPNRVDFEEFDSSPLFAFFATEKETNLPFLIHAPFLTTPPRDNINDDPRNESLLSALTELMVKAIEQLKANNLVDLRTWLVFPCNVENNSNEIYKLFYERFTRFIKHKNTFLLPTSDNNFCHVQSALRANNRELQELINSSEAKKIFSRSQWITHLIKNENYETINTFIEDEFEVPSIGYFEFCEKVDDAFFKQRTDEWLLKFYGCIADENKLWRAADRYKSDGPLRNKAFIRTTKNKTVKPFDEKGNLKVYLQNEGTSDYQFVKSIFIADKDSKRFFKAIHIEEPDLIAEVNEYVIPRIAKAKNLYNGHRADIQKIFKAIKKADSEEEKAMLSKLREIAWLPGRNHHQSKKVTLKKPTELYFPTRELTSLLSKSPTAWFLDSTLFTDFKSKQRAKNTLEDVGVFYRPRRFYKTDDDVVFETLNDSNEDYWNGDDIELEGLKEYLRKTLDKNLSVGLWSILTNCEDDWKESGFDATKFIQLLKNTKWLYNKFDLRLKPNEITPSELDHAYQSSSTLMDALDFKPDEIKDFELEHNVKVLTTDEFQQMRDKLADAKKEIERLKNQYEPIDKDESEDSFPDFEDTENNDALSSEEIPISDDEFPDDYQIDINGNYGNNGTTTVPASTTPTKRQRGIGKRGEEFVLKLLEEKHQDDESIEIKILNDDEKLGVACDFIIKKNDAPQTFIEVKSTEGGHENKFMISEKQWKRALKSHSNPDEPEYQIYCVYYAGSPTPQHIVIADPIEWMLKNKLRLIEKWFFNVYIKR